MEEFLATAADTAERLRSKHVRTLEAMQKLINENNELKAAAVGGPSRAVVDDVGIASLRADLEVQRASSERALSESNARWSAEVARLSKELDRMAGMADLYRQRVKASEEQLAACARPPMCDAWTDGPAPVRVVDVSTQASTVCSFCVDKDATLELSKSRIQALEKELSAAMSPTPCNECARKDLDIGSLTSQVSSLETELKATHKEVTARRAELEAAQKDAQSALADRDSARAARVAADAAAADAVKALSSVTETCGGYWQQIRQLNEALVASESTVAALQEQVSRLQVSASAKAEAERVSGTPFTHHVALTKENAYLREQLAALRSERRPGEAMGLLGASVSGPAIRPRPQEDASLTRPPTGPLGPIVKPHGTPTLRKGGSAGKQQLQMGSGWPL